ncbi:hypothetical protein AVEN_23949-1 [Araneus ventricosus]|uniref:Uncharacterized protein n=1 Tax=Araneus ventricosus TaxID=182803 RepID=A0A4Y2VTE9_ARAVE|nr:hypothetical protein AVEN_23949-1 [Araneus ventricosus]
MTRMRSELAPPPQTSAPNQRQIIYPPMYVLTCNRPHTGRIFSGIGFRTWNPKAPKPRGHRSLRSVKYLLPPDVAAKTFHFRYIFRGRYFGKTSQSLKK